MRVWFDRDADRRGPHAVRKLESAEREAKERERDGDPARDAEHHGMAKSRAATDAANASIRSSARAANAARRSRFSRIFLPCSGENQVHVTFAGWKSSVAVF